MRGKFTLTLFAILLLGFFLRIYRITSLPMYGDELTMVYDTYSILKTGRDATGEYLPLTFRMGAGRPGGYIYASLPFVAVFGPTEWGVRGLSVVSGLGIIVLVYFLGKKLFGEKVGLIASLLAAISPWEIYLSRGGFEAHFALFLALFGVTAFLYGKYFAWAVAWGLTVLTYPTFKLTLPIMLPLLLWFSDSKLLLKNKAFTVSLFVLMLFGIIVVRETLMGRSEQRFLSINIFSDSGTTQQVIQKINADRSSSILPELIKPVFYNKPYMYLRLVLDNYISNLSPKFLFLRGDGNPRHNPGEWGMLYLVELPLFFMGAVLLWKEKRKNLILLTIWILITPITTMLLGDPHALRNAFMFPPLVMISSYVLSKLTRRLFIGTIVLIAIQLMFILNAVYFLASNKFASFWSAAAKTESLQAIKDSGSGKKVALSTKIDNVEYAYQVYAKVDPNLVIEQYGKFPKIYGNVTITDK